MIFPSQDPDPDKLCPHYRRPDARAVAVPVLAGLYGSWMVLDDHLFMVRVCHNSRKVEWNLCTNERGDRGKVLKLLNAPTKS